MQQRIINMLEIGSTSELNVNSTLSFKPFINFLRTQLAKDEPAKKELLSYVLNRFETVDKNDEAMLLDELHNYKDLLDLLFVILTDVTEDEKQLYWGLCMPMSPTMFYGSELFYGILERANRYDRECSFCDADYQEFLKSKMEHYYGYILKQYYDFELQKKRPFVRTVKDLHSNFTRHFSVSLNTSFVEVKANKPLPQLDVASLRNYELAEDGLLQLAQLLPPDMFSFKGFTVTTVKDISHQHALESIRNSIVQNQDYT
ncbi:MAG TPA: hypothetical protein VLR49_08915, partial [Ferruginibacter sp.]|nr:hypothetical protein [Ferruginibacter sp.]